jgi:predicted aspartyl protease
MGLFYTDAIVKNIADRSRHATVSHMLVDTGSEATWVSKNTLESLGVQREKKDRAFQMANGTIITRGVGYALIASQEYETVDEVVFAEEGDLLILGARTLEGFNARVDPTNKRLVAAGPIPAASAKSHEE